MRAISGNNTKASGRAAVPNYKALSLLSACTTIDLTAVMSQTGSRCLVTEANRGLAAAVWRVGAVTDSPGCAWIQSKAAHPLLLALGVLHHGLRSVVRVG